jgi:hypothetical protein
MPKEAKKRNALPKEFENKIVVFPNADKKFHESWEPHRGMLNFPHPFRACFAGPPDVGKSMMAKNLLVHAKPRFLEVKIIHADHENTQEYKDLGEAGVEIIGHIPKPKDFKGEKKTLVIVDDIEMKDLPKDDKRALNRLFGYSSTHKNLSVICCTQDWFNIPQIVRRCSNLWVIWASNDLSNMNVIAQRIGIPNLQRVFDAYMPLFRDSLWLDMTRDSPFPMRKNGDILLDPETIRRVGSGYQ